MKRFILTALALAVALVFGGSAHLDAAPHGGHASHAGHAHVAVHAHAPVHAAAHVAVAHRPVAASHFRTIVDHGRSLHVPVHVRGYRGWASRCWFPGYRCYGYYGGDDQLWYYWYEPFAEYLPITYMSIYPPTAGIAPPMTGVPMAMPASPALPPGATFVPGPITAP